MATSYGPAPVTFQSTLLRSSLGGALQHIQSDGKSADDAKIEKGATEFESMLLATWMQQAEQSMATVPGAGDDEDTAGREQMMSLGIQSVATALAASGGIGIGRMIAHAMHATAEKAVGQPSSYQQDIGNLRSGV